METAKEKMAKGESLTPEQKAAVDGETVLREEMKALGATDV